MTKTITTTILRILIVEDQPEGQEILKKLFRRLPVLAPAAAHACRLIKAYEFDLVFLDYDLAGPGKGNGVVRERKQASGFCRLRCGWR